MGPAGPTPLPQFPKRDPLPHNPVIKKMYTATPQTPPAPRRAAPSQNEGPALAALALQRGRCPRCTTGWPKKEPARVVCLMCGWEVDLVGYKWAQRATDRQLKPSSVECRRNVRF